MGERADKTARRRIREFVAACAYKPGSEIQVSFSPDKVYANFYFSLEVPHRVTLKPIRVFRTWTYDVARLATMPEPVLLQAVKDQWTMLEDHETDEWFRFHGELVSDPHAAERLPIG